MKNKKINKAFTLVELIVVITTLAILATIGFISIQGYTQESRDVHRVSTINSIEKGLALYKAFNGIYPMPQDYITLIADGNEVGYQGNFGQDATNAIKMNKLALDPLDKSYYTYSVNYDKTKYQIIGFFEGSSNISINQNIISQANAANIDYSKRTIKSYGDELGVILSNTGSDINRPIQDFYDVGNFTHIDIKNYTGEVLVVINSLDRIENSTSLVQGISLLSGIKLNMLGQNEILMTSCPDGWSESSIHSIGSSAQNAGYLNSELVNTKYKICTSRQNNSIPSGSEIVMTSCPDGWDISSIHSPGTGPFSALYVIPGVGNSSVQICVVPEGQNKIPSGTNVIMPLCTNGWNTSDIYYIPVLSPASASCGFASCQVCTKK